MTANNNQKKQIKDATLASFVQELLNAAMKTVASLSVAAVMRSSLIIRRMLNIASKWMN